MLLGYYSGWSINRFLKIVSNGYIAGIIGAAMSHIIADLIASYLDPHLRTMIIGNSFRWDSTFIIYSST